MKMVRRWSPFKGISNLTSVFAGFKIHKQTNLFLANPHYSLNTRYYQTVCFTEQSQTRVGIQRSDMIPFPSSLI